LASGAMRCTAGSGTWADTPDAEMLIGRCV
jgi:hypothetical protein